MHKPKSKKRKSQNKPHQSATVTAQLAGGRGGKRPGSGRKPMPDAANRTFVTVFLRKDTVAQLRAIAGSHYIGGVLQAHLDRFPPSKPKTKFLRPAISLEEKEKRRLEALKPQDALERTYLKLLKADEKAAAKAAKAAAKA